MLSATQNESIAVLDMGSNSFHMVIGRVEHGEIRTLQTFREQVRLGEGLSDQGKLTEIAKQRALECLKQFGQRLDGMPVETVAAFGTNALRVAQNNRAFLRSAEAALGYPIEVISGIEEARLIYLGVAHSLPSDSNSRLVIDIGGGSTEFILGEGFQPQLMESLPMGCVSFMDRFFPRGELSKQNFQSAVNCASNELMRIRKRYRKKGWEGCYGSSGTVKAIAQACREMNVEGDIDLPALKVVKKQLISYSKVSDIDIEGLKQSRRDNLVAGLAILIAIFEVLKIERMQFSSVALREGALYDLIGRSEHEDVCMRSVKSMQKRFCIDTDQAERVRDCADSLFKQVAKEWKLSAKVEGQWLGWAADLHEVGLSIAHVQFHKHGAYILSAADMPGFTRPVQQVIAFLVRGHRRRFPLKFLEDFSGKRKESLAKVCLLLRLSVLLNRNRGDSASPEVLLTVTGKKALALKLKRDSFEDYPLTFAELTAEVERVAMAGFELNVVGDS
jgi:exopolyphosphatase/guanosine-5'-triphosphate,3'-diphosphate pyrophosphatase